MFDNFSDNEEMKKVIKKNDTVKEKLIVYDAVQVDEASLDKTKLKEKTLDAVSGRYYAQYYKNNKSKLSTNLAEANKKYMEYLPINVQKKKVEADFLEQHLDGTIVHNVVPFEENEDGNVYVVTFSDKNNCFFNKKLYTVSNEVNDTMYNNFFFDKTKDNLSLALDYKKQKLQMESILHVVEEANGVLTTETSVAETKELSFRDLLQAYCIMKNKSIDWTDTVENVVKQNIVFLNESVFNGLRRSKKKAPPEFWIEMLTDLDMFNSIYRDVQDLRDYIQNVEKRPSRKVIDFSWFEAYMVKKVNTNNMANYKLIGQNNVIKGWEQQSCFVFIEY